MVVLESVRWLPLQQECSEPGATQHTAKPELGHSRTSCHMLTDRNPQGTGALSQATHFSIWTDELQNSLDIATEDS